MCRSNTDAIPDLRFEAELKRKYGALYATRVAEEADARRQEDESGVEPIAIVIGNEHRYHRPEDPESHNVHAWTFYVRPDRPEMVEEVQVFLYVEPNPMLILAWAWLALLLLMWIVFYPLKWLGFR